MAKKAQKKRKQGDVSLHPLTLEEALRGAMETGKPPEPENKYAKRTATKRRLRSKLQIDKADPGDQR
jgi:hypothetical protein